MARKSSKTAHVMNLLAGDDSESPKEEAARENLAARQTSDSAEAIKGLTSMNQPSSAPTPISIIDMSSSAPDPVAELIKEQLEEAEAAEDTPPPSSPVMEPEKEVVKEVPKEVIPEKKVSVEPPIPSFQYLNVMEYIVKNAAPQYMKNFDVCTCDHCTADVTALALSHLPPKYIVVDRDSVSPLLNFYSTRFTQQVVVELTKACSVVKENPHH
ncbi:MAG: late competence development ComFB family protein [Lacrimispora sp.]|uniref:late competence development ComFB family protein n=1 Tax=Lacrimispora sp. TaxID=2719234 RepID=UPI0039E37E7A